MGRGEKMKIILKAFDYKDMEDVIEKEVELEKVPLMSDDNRIKIKVDDVEIEVIAEELYEATSILQ